MNSFHPFFSATSLSPSVPMKVRSYLTDPKILVLDALLNVFPALGDALVHY